VLVSIAEVVRVGHRPQQDAGTRPVIRKWLLDLCLTTPTKSRRSGDGSVVGNSMVVGLALTARLLVFPLLTASKAGVRSGPL